MAFLTFEDSTGQIEGVIFPQSFETYKNILEENKGFYIEGKILSAMTLNRFSLTSFPKLYQQTFQDMTLLLKFPKVLLKPNLWN